ncbi:MAG: tRNA pseudouridine(55) synthase TruB [Lachnospiraceae bacterium]|jgi:tRNA pseudouridine 55 synthase|nr:tRNA pseudouridine(55) synthase TruB [Lachnospiraceae bacterium]
MISGIINVYKEKGFTSHDVVAKLRGIFQQKKIGHTGTLDPDAEGVLPVCLGKATKVCDLLTDKDKEYETVLLLGKATDTQDITGAVISESPVTCQEEEIRKIIVGFVGAYSQIPPMYSALKVNGKKLCDLARSGVSVERAARDVQIFSIDILEVLLPRVKMRVHCSKGTYIRTLCHDIGSKAGCGGCMESLLRTRVAEFHLGEAKKLSEIEAEVQVVRAKAAGKELAREDFAALIRNTDSVFLQYPSVHVREEFSKLLYNGNPLEARCLLGWEDAYRTTTLRVYDARQKFAGIYRWDDGCRCIRPIKVFME